MRTSMRSAPRTTNKPVLLSAALGAIFLGSLSIPAGADGLLSDYAATPPLLTASGDKPNVLVILDNSNSMDEDVTGYAIGSDQATSKSEIARGAVKSLISSFNGKIRMGLMAYQQSGVVKNDLYNSWVYVSYDPANYNPSYTLPSFDPSSWAQETQRVVNPYDSAYYIYYNRPLALYMDPADKYGATFCYSPTYSEPAGSPKTNAQTYNCYAAKTGTADDASGYSSLSFTTKFIPTDSDYAQGFRYFGKRLAFEPTGSAWFSGGSPGLGKLHVPIADLDSAQAALLNAKLATSHPATDSATDTPLRNAGLTPLPGTLDTAYRYFTGGTIATSEGGSDAAIAIPENSCGQQDYVVLVTDGLPSVDSSGNPYTSTSTAISDTIAKAAALNAAGVKVYVVGFALPVNVDPTLLDDVANAGGTTSAYFATDTTSLNTALGTIFQDIMTRTSSASNAAVVSNNNAGEGALYQALYSPELTRSNASTGVSSTVSWTGQVHAVFIDTYGKLREDSNGNKQLDDYASDKIIQFSYDAAAGRTMLSRYNSADPVVPTGLTLASTAELDDLIPIWDARDALANLDNTSIGSQRGYNDVIASTGASRYIFTWIDNSSSGTPGVVDAAEVRDFTATALSGSTYQYLAESSLSAARKVVDFVRGKEGISGFRSRSIDYDGDGVDEVLRLGDIVHSTPVVVGIPSDGYDLLYGDYTYTTFRNHYKGRRQVTYVGANDGMLHAFNGGFWDNSNKRFVTTNGTETAQPLGAELWGYVPQALLPHLKWLTDTNYPHVYYVDGPPLVFDANIFSPDTDHPGGWGTVLVVGMRFGGGPFTVDSDGNGSVEPGTDKTLRSSYVVMDITNPEAPPTLIAEIGAANLGFTTGKPTVVKARMPSASGSWSSPSVNQWYLVFGSGPDDLNTATSSQTAKVYAYRLDYASRGMVSGFAPYDLGGANAFVGDLASIDWNADFLDDGVYFGTVSGTTAAPSGNLKRFNLDTVAASSDGSPWTAAGINSLIASSQPFVSAPLFANDPTGRSWVFAGTGRLFVGGDNTSDTQQTFYGVMEPVDSTGTRTWGTVSDLRDSTDIEVYTDSSITPTTLTNKAGDTITSFSGLQADVASRDGWKIEFSAPGGGTPSERNLSSASRIGSSLLFTSYTPSADACSPEGTSKLWAVNYRTGTASPYAAIGTSSTVVNAAGAYAAVKTIDLGLGMSSTPLIHRGAGASGGGTGGDGGGGGSGSADILTQNSTTEVTQTSLTLEGAAGGRQSWRELEIDW